MIGLQELEVFLAIVEHGSFSEAARYLHLSQPAVSQTIQTLEKRFQMNLFDRQGRTVRLTEAGQTLAPLARELLTSSRRLEEMMHTLHSEIGGRLVIGCSTASGKYLLPGLIARFRRRYPNVRIDVEIQSREGVISRLLEGGVGFGVSSKQIEHRDLVYQPFFSDEVSLIVPAGHPWTRHGRVTPDDLLDIPVILREESSGTREVLRQALQEHDLTLDMLNVVMVLGNAEAIAMAVGEGIGAAFVSRLAAVPMIALGRITEIKVEGMRLCRELFFARNQRLPLTRSQSAFWEFMLAEVQWSSEENRGMYRNPNVSSSSA